MITQEVREFILSDINTLYSKRPKELGYTPFNVGESLKSTKKWADDFKSRVESKYQNPISFEEALKYLSTYESNDKIKSYLEELCIKAVEEALGFKFEDLKLRDTPVECKPSLIPPTENAFPSEKQEVEDKETVFNEEFRKHSNRRRVLHGITACAGLKAGTNLHQLVYSELNKIDPKLIECYDVVGLRTIEDTYTQNPMALYMMYKQAGEGNMDIQNGVETEVEEDDNGEQSLSIKASAISFNMLLHETVKGVFNLFMQLNIPMEIYDDEDQLKLFYKESDDLGEEYLHFLSSMNMYNELTNWCIEKELPLIDVFKQLNICEPEDTIEFLMCLHEDEPEDLDYIWEVHIQDKKDEWENENN